MPTRRDVPDASALPVEPTEATEATEPTEPTEPTEAWAPAEVLRAGDRAAGGLDADLRRCLSAWQAERPEAGDLLPRERGPSRALPPVRLHGRDEEFDRLSACWRDVAARGGCTVVLIDAPSGSGKTRLVTELQRSPAGASGLWICAKGDQYARVVPHAALSRALPGLVPSGPDGPEDAASLPGAEAPARLHAALARRLHPQTAPGRPLVLWFDDLQWLDPATLDFVEHLVVGRPLEPLLLLLGFRGAELEPALAGRLRAWRQAAADLHELVLRPLEPAATAALVADSLRLEVPPVERLGRRLHDVAGGNPLYTLQMLAALVDDGRLDHDAATGRWDCDPSAPWVSAPASHDLPALVVAQLRRLDEATLRLLRWLVLQGPGAEPALMASLEGTDVPGVARALAPAIEAGLVRDGPGGPAFVHDRIEEAARTLVPPAEQPALRLAIARALQQRTDDGSRTPAQRYAIAEHLIAAAGELRGRAERQHAARLILQAARAARAAAAHEAARRYADGGLALVGDDAEAPGRFALGLVRAEALLMTGCAAEASTALVTLGASAPDLLGAAEACRLAVAAEVLQSRYAQAVELALAGLRRLGVELPAHPEAAELEAEQRRTAALLGERTLESLVQLPAADDPRTEAATGLLAELFAPACFTDERLALMHLERLVGLTLERGLTAASAHGFAWYGVMIGHHRARYADGARYATLAHALARRRGDSAFEAKARFALELTTAWTAPIDVALGHARAAHRAGIEQGDPAIACFARHHIVNHRLLRGDALADVAAEVEAGLDHVRRAGYGDVEAELLTQQRFVAALRGATDAPGSFDGPGFDTAAFEAGLTPGRMPTMIFWYWVARAQLASLTGNPAAGEIALQRAEQWSWSSPVQIQALNYRLHAVLILAAQARAGAAGPVPGIDRRAALARHRDRLASWAEHAPSTCAGKLMLADAEIAWMDGRELEAERLYDRAMVDARRAGCWPDEGLAADCAARFHAARGLATLADACRQRARLAWSRWGATSLAGRDGHDVGLAAAGEPPALDTLLQISESLSAELRLDRLVERLLELALALAGARRGLLLMNEGERLALRAEATAARGSIDIRRREGLPAAHDLPLDALEQAVRTQQAVVQTSARGAAAAGGALLCLPLVRQGVLTGVLYLEHALSAQAFTVERTAALRLLASQAAGALENARLYEELRRENHERRQAEAAGEQARAAWLESEGRFRRMADATPDVIWITDLEPERVLYASPSFERIWGRRVEDLYRDPRLWVEGIHPEDRARVGAEFGAWIDSAGRGPWEAEFRVRSADGSVRWIHERGFVIAGADGHPQRVSGVSTDITARRTAEAALRATEERFALAVAGSTDGIWDWDIVHDRLFMSERAQRVHGLEPGLAVRPRADWLARVQLHPDDRPRAQQLHEDYLAQRVPVYDDERRVRHPDGLYRWVRVRGQCVRDAAGRATRMAGSVTDVDAQKRAEVALRQTQRLEAVGTLAGGIAHDFNNILGAILGFGEMCLRGTRAGSRQRRDLECIVAAGERGRALVERVLAFSRSGVGERVPVALEPVVREALELLAAGLPDLVVLETDLRGGAAAVLGDSTQMHQVAMNLVTNAVQAMPQGGRLRVGLETQRLEAPRLATTGPIEAGEHLVLSVADEGTGIAPEVRARIFDPFFTTKEAGAGTGLGLSLVHGIVTEAGGAIDVETVPGAGSRFVVWLPRAEPPAAPAAPAAVVSTRLPRGRHQQVLVVDDEEALVRLTTETLGGLGYVAIGFASGEAALAAFRAHPERFDAVLTDERMPGLNGIALVRALRELRPELPALLVSGHVGDTIAERARAAGVARVLRKPLAARELAAAMAALLPSPAPAAPVRLRPRAPRRPPPATAPG